MEDSVLGVESVPVAFSDARLPARGNERVQGSRLFALAQGSPPRRPNQTMTALQSAQSAHLAPKVVTDSM